MSNATGGSRSFDHRSDRAARLSALQTATYGFWHLAVTNFRRPVGQRTALRVPRRFCLQSRTRNQQELGNYDKLMALELGVSIGAKQ